MRAGAVVVASLFAFAGCAGANQSVQPHLLPGGQNGNATVALHLGLSSNAIAHVRRDRTSPATNGISVNVYFHSDAQHSVVVGSAAFDVSAASTICVSGVSGRTCTLNIPAPVPTAGDSDDIVVQTYDTAPSAGTIPTAAKLLDSGALNVVPIAGALLNELVTLAGVVANVSVAIDNPNAKYGAALYGGSQYNVEVSATDASGASIIGSDAFATPLVLSASSGAIMIDGAVSSSLHAPSDVVTFVAPTIGTGGTISVIGFPASVSFLASPSGTNGSFTTGATLATYIATGSDGLIYASSPNALYVLDPAPSPALMQTIAAPSGFTFEGIVTSQLGAPYSAALVALTDGSNADFAGVAGGALQATITGPTNAGGGAGQPVVANGAPFITNGNQLCSVAACQTTSDTANQAIVGPDGNLWLAQNGGIAKIAYAAPNFTSYTLYASGLPTGAIVSSLANGADANIYFLESHGSGPVAYSIGKITTAGAISETPLTGIIVSGNIIAGPDNAMWFCAGQKLARYDLTSQGVATFARRRNIRPDNSTPIQLWATLGPDGAIWTVDSFKKIERFTP